MKKFNVPIIVYQMGKVGSTSVFNSIKAAGVKSIYHVHRMYPENIISLENALSKKNIAIPKHLETGIEIYQNIISKSKEAKFITLVREPVERNISAFFQNFCEFMGEGFVEEKISIEKIIWSFKVKYDHRIPLDWFDIEPKRTLGIDVYEYNFNPENGYQVLKQGPFEMLLLRTEISDDKKADCISRFIGEPNLKIKRSNLSQDKNYSKAIERVKNTIALDKDFIYGMYNNKFVKHFFSKEEIERLTNKWLK